VIPEYEEMPGWTETDKVVGSALPRPAAQYIERVSELTGVPVWVTSIGPGRSETIVNHNPFVRR
jgi:adenylosuccinate synthase